MGDLPHSATKAVADQRTFIHDSLALEVLVAGKGERFSNPVKRVDWLLLMLRPFTRCAYNNLGLMSKVCCQLPVRGHHLSRRMISLRSRVECARSRQLPCRSGLCVRGTHESVGCGD